MEEKFQVGDKVVWVGPGASFPNTNNESVYEVTEVNYSNSNNLIKVKNFTMDVKIRIWYNHYDFSFKE